MGAERAGVALVRTQAVLEEVHVESGGADWPAVQLVSSDVRIRGLEVQGGRSSGLVAREGSSRSRTRPSADLGRTDSAEGDAVQIRGGRASLTGVRVAGVQRHGVLAAEGAHRDAGPRRPSAGAGVAGLAVETEARLTATEVSIERTPGPAVLVTDRATADAPGR